MTNGLGKDIDFESAFHRSMDRSKRLLLEVLQSSFAVPCEALQPPHTASFCILLWKCRSFCERRHAWQTIASPYQRVGPPTSRADAYQTNGTT